MPDFDAIIIGTGQAGPSLAFRLAGAGMKVAVVERHLVGGTCVNTGCTPTKALVASAYAARTARRAAEYGVVIGGDIGIDMRRVKARADAIVAASRNGLTSALENAANITLYRGHTRFASPQAVEVAGERLHAGRIFINVGGRALVPPMPGINEVPYLTNSSMMDVDFLPQHLIIVGGSYIGLEFGQMYRGFGREVTIIEQAPRLVRHEDEDVSAAKGHRRARGRRGEAQCRMHQPRQARRRDHRQGRLHRRRPRSRWLASVAGSRPSAEYRRSGSRQSRGALRRAWLHRRRRRIANHCARYLGSRRLQWQGRFHPHRLQ